MIRVCAIVACLLVIAAGLLVIAAGFMTQTQLRADFAKDPATLGWALVDPKPGVKADGAWLKKADGSERNCIVATTGRWESPQITMELFQYYRLAFQSKAAGKGTRRRQECKCVWFSAPLGAYYC